MDRTSVQLTYTEGQAPPSTHLLAVASGTPPSTIYIGAVVEGTGISPYIPVLINGMQADLTLTAASLSAGTYTGRVLLIASTDPAGANKVGGTPIAVAYSVTVKPGLKVTPAALSLSGAGGQIASGSLQVQFPEGTSSFTARVLTASPWLSLGTPSGSTLPVSAGPSHSGNYSASIEISSGGQTVTVQVSYTASVPVGGEQELAASPASLSFTTTENRDSSTLPLGVTLSSWAPSGPLQVVVNYNGAQSGWLKTTQTASGLNVVASATTLSQGSYSASLVLSAPGSSLVVPVSVSVGPGLVVSPASFSFQTSEHADAPVQTATFSLLNWPSASNVQVAVEYIGAASGWLLPTRTATGLNLLASAAALSQGTYAATLVLTPPTPGTTLRVPVSLSVAPGLVAPGARTLRVDADATAASLSASDTIQVVGGPPVNWVASTSTPWLHLTRASGSTGSDLTYSVDLTAIPALPNFSEQQGTISIQVPQTTLTPVTLQVTLQKALPEVAFVAPYLVVAGQESRVILRGRGFSGVQDLAARLAAPGLMPGAVTPVSDTEASFLLTPSSAATVPVSIGNALGLATPSATLQVIDPQTYAYAAIPTGGNKRALVLDAQRQSLYAVNVDGETLVRFKYQGSAWGVDAASIPAILDAGMAPDGASIVVTATPGRLRLLDPDTLATQFTLDHPAGFSRNFTYLSEGILPMNNGRSWLATGSGWNELAYFDHRTRTMQPRESQPGLQTSFYGGPWMVASRDGSRMLVGQSAGMSPTPPMLFLNAADNLLQVAPGVSGNSYYLSYSERAERLMLAFNEVRDQDWGLVGRANIPDTSYFPVAQALSPDGRRAYLLAYRGDVMGDWPTAVVPRVYVFDISTLSATSTNLPCLGQFEVADYPTCRTTACDYRPRSGISPDGRTLFFVGSVNLIVVPVPASFR